jgi:hypothetical protein
MRSMVAAGRGPHGSRFDYLLARRYETADFTIESAQTYDLCYQLPRPQLDPERRKLPPAPPSTSSAAKAPCSACHTAHGVSGSQTQHSHLINFDSGIVQGERRFTDLGNQHRKLHADLPRCQTRELHLVINGRG